MTTPIKSIRAYCLECSNQQPSEVKNCHLTDCPLWPYRMGKNPARAGIGPKQPPFLKNQKETNDE